jgi:hypothetical protein
VGLTALQAQQVPPRQRQWPATQRRLCRIAKAGQRRLELGQVGLTALHPLQPKAKGTQQAAQAGIGRQGADQRLSRHHGIRQRPHLVQLEVENAVAAEEIGARRQLRHLHHVGAARQRSLEAAGGIVGLTG